MWILSEFKRNPPNYKGRECIENIIEDNKKTKEIYFYVFTWICIGFAWIRKHALFIRELYVKSSQPGKITFYIYSQIWKRDDTC